MTSPPHELSNLFLAGKYFQSLPTDDVSRRFAAGEKYVSNWYNRLKIFFSIDSTLSELNRFYPYQPIVKRTYEMYQEKRNNNRSNALVFSGISISLVYLLAKQNFVLPIFSKFGRFLKSHRLFRQYVWLLVLPTVFAEFQTNKFFLNQTDKLWQVHASRMNEGILNDPEDSQYPISELPVSQVYSWSQPYVHRYDLPKKWANEVPIFLAPDYSNIEEWEKVPIYPAADEGEEEGEEGGEEQQ